MSLNGDTIIMRNGRSTSQVSIYNYPEHLNPFYEDDQHKRLRFWHIKKNKDEGRRNSFSLGGLKDMWAFKSLRNKKKSSTLGINKTSESPPPLRRDIANGFYTYDPRTRHSGDTNAVNNNNFQRNIPYRSSLQDMNSVQKNYNGLGFIRNDQCRSTTQSVGTAYKTMPSSKRYMYGGSLSPQPLRSAGSAKGNLSVPQSHGSQTSVNTNPFDIEDIEVSEANSTDEIIDYSNTTLAKTNLRKKRRAPAPPCITAATTAKEPRNLVLATESSQQSPSAQTELHIEEDVNISNLTAEIESFVKASNDIAEAEPKNVRSASQNEIEPPVHTTTLSPSTTKHASLALNSTGTVSKGTTSPSSPTPHTVITTVELKQVKTVVAPKTKMIQPKAKRESEEGRIECIHIHVDSPRTTPDINESSKLTSFQPQSQHNDEIITSQTSFVLSSPPSSIRNPNKEIGTLSAKSVINPKSPPVPMRRSAESYALSELKIGKETVPVHKGFEIAPPVVDNPSVILEIKTNEPEMPIRQAHLNEALKTKRQGQQENELPENTKQVMETKYTNKEDVSAPAVSPEPLKIVETVDSPLEINFKNNLYRNEPRSRLEWKKSTLAPLETHVPPEKRKSVKDIIESINRSQRLLHAAALKNQPQTSTSDNELVSANGFSPLYQTKNIELNNFDTRRNTPEFTSNNVKLASDKSESRACPPKYEEVECEVIAASGNVTLTSDDDTEADPLKLNNSVIFEKFRVNKDMRQLRESSPTASNLDWNPVPKPKRTKNLTDI